MNLYILNEKPKVPFKALKSEMELDDFLEFITEFLECHPYGGYWAVNYNNPEWSPALERPFLDFVKCVDPQEIIDQVQFTSLGFDIFGDILVIYTPGKPVEVNLVYGMEDYWENEVCIDCFSTLFMDDPETAPSFHEAVGTLIKQFPIIQHDQSRDSEFGVLPCDCCSSPLAGTRYMLICMKED
jgi:hypothetical protein